MKKIARRSAEYNSIKEMLTEQARLHGDSVIFSYRNKASDEEKVTVTLDCLLEDVRDLGTELINMGAVGKHCAVIGKLTYGWIKVYLSMLSTGTVIVPMGFPAVEKAVRDLGYPVILVDTSEYRKLDGGLSCLSLRF